MIGDYKFDDAMLDLGALLMSCLFCLYNFLGLGPLSTTGVVIQLANRSNAHPFGVIEDVLVRAHE